VLPYSLTFLTTTQQLSPNYQKNASKQVIDGESTETPQQHLQALTNPQHHRQCAKYNADIIQSWEQTARTPQGLYKEEMGIMLFILTHKQSYIVTNTHRCHIQCAKHMC
jgi:hypothetical protein